MERELSIIIPVYNVEKYLKECLDSIYAVENIDKEVILVNDGSTDGSLEILKEYEKKYPTITKLIDKKNGGVSSARNAGIQAAEGEYISFIDSDDWIDPKKYEEFFKSGQEKKLDIMMSAPIAYKDSSFKVWEYPKELRERIEEGKELLKKILENNILRFEVWDDIYSRKMIVENALFFKEGILYEDGLFTVYILNISKKAMILDKNFYFYRQREGSIMTDKSIKAQTSSYIVNLSILFDKDFKERSFKTVFFRGYQGAVVDAKILYLKEHIKLLFLSNLNFQERLWLLKVLKYIKKIKWSIKL